MLFAVHWSFGPEDRDEINERFLETGAPPPDGVRMLGRWHTVGEGEGFCIAETDDLQSLGVWIQEWSDLMDFRIQPVVDDGGIGAILSAKNS